MSHYSENDFCSKDEGLDYIFAYMSAVYGSAFDRHFESADPTFVRKVWMDLIGSFLTYRPSMDYAFGHLHPDFPPSAIKFRDLCNCGPSIPPKQTLIENKPKEFNQAEYDKVKAEGLEKLHELKKMFKGRF